MSNFSYSRVNCFTQCPLKYRFTYYDKIAVSGIDKSLAEKGSALHEAFEQYKIGDTVETIMQYINENIEIGVFKGDATNLVNVPTGSQSKVIIENPNGFDPLNPEILRVVKEGGEIEITGIKSNKEFFNIYSGEVEVPKGFEIIEVGEIPENFQKQGFRTDGKLIGQKNGVGTPKKTDKIIRIRKIKK
mgnify:CR=1 FL=1